MWRKEVRRDEGVPITKGSLEGYVLRLFQKAIYGYELI